jgi:hypothetical protein
LDVETKQKLLNVVQQSTTRGRVIDSDRNGSTKADATIGRPQVAQEEPDLIFRDAE